VAPHAVYYRRVWHDFGIAHVTDAHVARRIDRFRPTLYNLGRPEAAARMYNWNDRFRGFIRYANYLHAIGALDVILATGDMYDYQFEYDDDDGNGQGNARFLRDLLLGRAPGPDFPDVEELRVPIFMVPGNHDYRMHPYHLIFDLDFVGHHRFTTYENYHLQSGDALALWTGLYGGVEDGVPDLDVDSTARMVEIDPGLRPYREALADRGSYVVRLGAHRIVMLDSAHDVGVLTSGKDALREYFGFVSENEHTFAGGSPNCEGVSEAELKLAADALAGTADDGLFILGIHAPLFNLWHDELPYFLRQTQRPAQPGQDVGFLARHGRKPLPGTEAEAAEFVKKEWRLWFPGDHDHRDAVFVKRGGTQDLLDYGVSRGRSEDLLRLLAGIGSRRPADVVLSGHTHRHNEFVVHTSGAGELAFYMDFYTTNPLMYYPASYLTGYRSLSSGKLTTNNDVTYVEVDSEATADATPWPMPYAAAHAKQLQVPPYPTRCPTARTPAPGGRPTGRWCSRPARSARWRTTRSASAASGCCRSRATSSTRSTPSRSTGWRPTATGCRWRTRAGPTRPVATATPNARAGTTRRTPRASRPRSGSRSWASAT
jgi:predicted phosphodiesterase